MRQTFDKLKEERDSSSVDHTRISALQEENAELLGVISSSQAKEQVKARSADQIQATSFVLEGQKEIEDRLQEALNAKVILAARLSEAQKEAVYYNKRADELNFALQLSPNEVANLKGVIELKDKMFSDLEERANECFNNLTELNKSSNEDKELAGKEIAMLENKLDKSEQCVVALQNSKKSIQRHCIPRFAFLITPSANPSTASHNAILLDFKKACRIPPGPKQNGFLSLSVKVLVDIR